MIRIETLRNVKGPIQANAERGNIIEDSNIVNSDALEDLPRKLLTVKSIGSNQFRFLAFAKGYHQAIKNRNPQIVKKLVFKILPNNLLDFCISMMKINETRIKVVVNFVEKHSPKAKMINK
jgi:hypothetical protein